MVDLAEYIVLQAAARVGELECPGIPSDVSIGHWKDGEVRLHTRGNGKLLGGCASAVCAHDSVTRICRQRGKNIRQGFKLPQPLIVGEEKGLVLPDRPADGAAKLGAVERRDVPSVKKIPGVQRA